MKVLYLLAAARSGNTVLGRVLGELDGFFQAGEVRFLWERAIEGRRCGCGARVAECEIWGPVLAHLEHEGIDAADVVRWQREATRLYHTPRIAWQRPGAPSGVEPLDRYVTAIREVYATLARLTGARVIVDTSQRPSNGAALRLAPDIDAYFIHLVRDPRGFAWSQRRGKPNPDRDVPGVLQEDSLGTDIVFWSGTNLAAEMVRRSGPPDRSRRLAYERFVAEPRLTVQRIVRFLGEPLDGTPFVDERSVHLGVNHTVSGNPDRFTTGLTQIRLDDRWVREMPGRDRWIMTAATLPLLRRYGYDLRPETAASRATRT